MKKEHLFLILIILLGLILRLSNVNWDLNLHLHPDERFLTMVGNAMVIPRSLSEYLNPYVSHMNPANIQFPFFVYGIFPLAINKIIAVFLNHDTYDLLTLQGRIFSALLDSVVIFAIYKTVGLWKSEKNLKLWAAFFYAAMVLPIQLSHYFTVDIFLSAFSFFSFAFLLAAARSKRSLFIWLSAICFGLALASKINAVFILPLLVYGSLKYYFSHKPSLLRSLIFTAVYGALVYFTLRLASPYYFQSANLFYPSISKLFFDNIKSLKSFDGNDTWYPPSIQWISKSRLFTLTNIAFFGIGLVDSLFVLLGGVIISLRKNKSDLHVILGWVILFILYQSFQFVQTMRYLIFIYPYLAIIAAVGVTSVTRGLKHQAAKIVPRVIIVCVLVWPLAFISIYLHPQSRLIASEWIYNHIPPHKTILGEYWDDFLPMSSGVNSSSEYTIIPLKVFDQDTPDKFSILNQELATGDYYILSSNRAWASIMSVPDKYPTMSAFYRNLLSSKTPYKKIAEFTSYPSLRYLGIPIDFPDQWAEEAFTVYDHPMVMVFKNTAHP